MGFWKFILKVLLLIVLILLIMVSCGIALPAIMAAVPWIASLYGWMGALVAAGSWGMLAAIGIGALAVVDPGALETVGEVVGDAAHVVVGIAGDVVGSAFGTFFSSPIGFAAVGFGIWFFFLRDKKREDEPDDKDGKVIPQYTDFTDYSTVGGTP